MTRRLRRQPSAARRAQVRRADSAPRIAVPTAFITHPSSLLHDMGPYHPECPERLTAIGDRLISAGLDSYLHALHGAGGDARASSRACTARDYIATIEAASPASGLHFIDPDTALNPAFADRGAARGGRAGPRAPTS